ncbi:2Fe-2S iron-sulfur cluster binding domain protein [Dissophora ornata]|nr:hypothetical protein BGZ58_010292 [Dissophora ornata]KAI8596432.1 2Fe-2S iron-sulfur cluster binding domain protein [Dissophora ornata]
MASILAASYKKALFSATANAAAASRTGASGIMGALNGSVAQRSVGSFGRIQSAGTGVHRSLSFNNRFAQFSTASGIQYAKRGRPGPGQGFQVNFVTQDGEEISVQAHEGESLLDVAWANDIDIEGACEASLACSTCHLILDTESYSKLEEPTDEENDMLDLAFGLTDTSRLGCQVLMNKELDGIIAKMPAMTRNAQG